ncbi:DUF2336 domain-containing protein [Neorhizobium alkalisoli]|uniref:Uncharacterized protein (DUF2336 family) n=1 Tax=Neorhizobium alkalisoli TaxID=528178 RepID=A0A561Q7P2_9HYPH|nr:DUF2336 domain-containing protein [Neorhizobium alkalisoli]TWF46357.1 uncharacterized protein (DUF2336 family) [Neorhizobium alkalisoli]
MIVQAFLRWAETAKVADRAKAADALARAYLQSQMGGEERKAAGLAMTYLLDDPSPRVRLALAEAVCTSPDAPRAIVMTLAEDQPEVACTIIACSPVLSESDLVDLAGRGDEVTRGLIASRPGVTRGVAAAIAEIGDETEIVLLLENPTADITRSSLRRMAERFGRQMTIRNLLLERETLPADARHMLVRHVADAILSSGLVRSAIGGGRLDHMGREAEEAATVAIASDAGADEIPSLVEHLRITGRLTPAFLIHALCAGKADFVSCAVSSLSGLGERRVRPILATGREHAVRALFLSCGLSREIALVFVEAVFLWRDATADRSAGDICAMLIERFSRKAQESASIAEMMDMIEKLNRLEIRARARAYASDVCLAA